VAKYVDGRPLKVRKVVRPMAGGVPKLLSLAV
jgi:hypothetical protein